MQRLLHPPVAVADDHRPRWHRERPREHGRRRAADEAAGVGMPHPASPPAVAVVVDDGGCGPDVKAAQVAVVVAEREEAALGHGCPAHGAVVGGAHPAAHADEAVEVAVARGLQAYTAVEARRRAMGTAAGSSTTSISML